MGERILGGLVLIYLSQATGCPDYRVSMYYLAYSNTQQMCTFNLIWLSRSEAAAFFNDIGISWLFDLKCNHCIIVIIAFRNAPYPFDCISVGLRIPMLDVSRVESLESEIVTDDLLLPLLMLLLLKTTNSIQNLQTCKMSDWTILIKPAKIP